MILSNDLVICVFLNNMPLLVVYGTWKKWKEMPWFVHSFLRRFLSATPSDPEGDLTAVLALQGFIRPLTSRQMSSFSPSTAPYPCFWSSPHIFGPSSQLLKPLQSAIAFAEALFDCSKQRAMVHINRAHTCRVDM